MESPPPVLTPINPVTAAQIRPGDVLHTAETDHLGRTGWARVINKLPRQRGEPARYTVEQDDGRYRRLTFADLRRSGYVVVHREDRIIGTLEQE